MLTLTFVPASRSRVWMTGWMWNTGKEEGEVGIGSARAGPEKMHGKKRVGS